MTMRAVVERGTSSTDDYNNPDSPTWTMHLAALACWLWTGTEREVFDTRKTAVTEDIVMIVPKGTDITESDRIASVADRRGVTIHPGVLTISTVINRREHLELVLQGVS